MDILLFELVFTEPYVYITIVISIIGIIVSFKIDKKYEGENDHDWIFNANYCSWSTDVDYMDVCVD